MKFSFRFICRILQKHVARSTAFKKTRLSQIQKYRCYARYEQFTKVNIWPPFWQKLIFGGYGLTNFDNDLILEKKIKKVLALENLRYDLFSSNSFLSNSLLNSTIIIYCTVKLVILQFQFYSTYGCSKLKNIILDTAGSAREFFTGETME
ncbi:conserved hypothetical protein [Trichinella spiralis]|uniref:hypothetical protein n=1 Tax=Trichinella spiralis TaxID=6334 RepID=UPI0001EFB5CD|nr:conserved hypothetical protein [Trichinella spiralis]